MPHEELDISKQFSSIEKGGEVDKFSALLPGFV